MKRLKKGCAVLTGLLLTSILLADDIEVFKTNSGVKPNILFVFDRSGSMELDVNGNETSDEALRRSSILRDAFKSLLETNKETINAGLGPFYRTDPTGVKWPIGDLTQNAHEIDADIPASAGWTSQTIIDRLFDSDGEWGNTNIVDALFESALYFRGDEVRANGGSWDDRFKPDVWNATDEIYENGYHGAPHPATYSPANAYTADATPLPDETGTCNDYSIGGTVPSGWNGCEADSSYTRYDSCTYKDAVPGVGTECKERQTTCHSRNVDGQCTDSSSVCLLEGPASDQAARNECTWYREDRFEGSWSGANYQTPIADSCQSNYIILLSDGEPTNREASSEIQSLIGTTSCQDLSGTIFAGSDPSDANDGDCGIELAEYLANNDQVSTVQDSVVNTYTIGFGVGGPGQAYLTELATAGGGEFYPANDATQLNEAFSNILKSISGETEAFTAVSVDVDKANFSSDNRAFFSLFLPDGGRSWRGNLKGYFIDSEGLKDVTGVDAITTTDAGAVFSETSQSFWSTAPDGNLITEGGASGKLDPASRNLYTYTGDGIPDNENLTHPLNILDISNNKITSAMLDGANPDVLETLRNSPMADPLHTQPVTIKYQDRTVVYTMTNQGLLHAFDATAPIIEGETGGGSELWAFMPQALLKNLGPLMANLSTGEHIYGLDGGMTRWLDESVSENGVITAGEDAILYIGMRRGGNHYYAIDVSNPLAPRLKWRIDGGSSNYLRLGQSWSRMALTTMKDGTTEKKVLVLGGGYDDRLDGSTSRMSLAADGSSILGNAVYIVDALTGLPLWSINNDNADTDMRYAIPADINVIDGDMDGLADRLYFGDLGGQIWRIDFPGGDLGNSGAITVNRLAELGTDSSFQPFFYTPSVALISTRVDNYLAVAVGSGSRDNPLNPASDNHIYMLKDKNTDAGAPVDTTDWPYSAADLYDASLNLLGSSDNAIAQAAQDELKLAAGWLMKLQQGEKALSETTIFQDELLFTTYAPATDSASSSDPCAVAGSIGRFYRVNVRDARPVEALSQSGDDTSPLTAADRSSTISTHGIPGPATIVFPKNSESVDIYVGQNKVSEISQKLTRVLWYSQ